MMFLLRAAFWLAIVSAFVPRDFAGEAMDLPFELAETQIDAGAQVGEWCEDQEAICEAGEEALRLGGFLADVAVDRIEAAIEDHQERDAS